MTNHPATDQKPIDTPPQPDSESLHCQNNIFQDHDSPNKATQNKASENKNTKNKGTEQAITDSEIIELDATQLLAALAAGALCQQRVMTVVQQHIAAINPTINAFDSLNHAIFEDSSGPLGGLPISIKDQIQVSGLPCHYGMDKPQGGLCEHTAGPVTALLQAGAKVIGKTHLPPLAMDFQTHNKRIGRCNNPHNPDYSTGGSSGGGAAAVAAGMSYLDIGADLAGSLRIPAAFCGVFCLLPSEGALATTALAPGGQSLAHFARIGPMTRSVNDLSLAWQHLSGTEPEHDLAAPIKLAVWQDKNAVIDPDNLQVFQQATAALQAAGIETQANNCHSILNTAAYNSYGEIMGYETGALIPAISRLLARIFGAGAAARSANFLPAIHRGYRRSLRRYNAALAQRQLLQRDFDREFAEVDALLLPVTQLSAFKHRLPDSDRGGLRDYKKPFIINDREVSYLDALTHFTTPISLIGNPVVTVPLGKGSQGMPVGAQLVGKRGQEWALLALARRVSAHLT